jgi:hypothetical protein
MTRPAFSPDGAMVYQLFEHMNGKEALAQASCDDDFPTEN